MASVSTTVNNQLLDRAARVQSRHYLVDVWRRFRRNYLALAGLIVLIVLVGAALAAPVISTGEPNKADLRPEMSLVGPSLDHLFGTDDAGRDWFTRSLYGARVSLLVAFFAMAISIAIGTTVGCIAGFFGGWCMGAVEVFIVMTCLGLAPTWSLALTVEVLSVAIDALLFFVPAKAGVQEGGKALIFRLLGLDPTNNNAPDRAIVIHSSWYANPDMIAKWGKLGRSQGCFAVAESDLETVFLRLGQGRLIYSAKA